MLSMEVRVDEGLRTEILARGDAIVDIAGMELYRAGLVVWGCGYGIT